jgi:NAD(P)-dependent dehydrogenase (short-subunit alcohol dehydrogenase family)
MFSDPVLTTRPILDRFRLDGRTAFVTGAGQGIGRAYAHALGEAGAKVALVGLTLAKLEEVADELASKKIDVIAVPADVTNPESMQSMVDAIVKKWKRLDIAVNNAGIGQWVPAEQMSVTDWDRVLDVNLKGVFLGAQAAARVMLPAGYGKIINTSSISGSIVNIPQTQTHYNTAKAGVIHLTKSLAAEWATRGVRVNSISPGYMRTKLTNRMLKTAEGQSVYPTWMRMTPMDKLGEVTDLQGAVVFLAAEVSDFMTGQDMIIDGGYTVW